MSWRKIGLNSTYLAVASIAPAGLGWLIVIVIAHLDGPVLLGEYSLAQAYATPAYYLASLSIPQQILVATEGGASLPNFIFLRVVVPALIFCLLLVFIWFCYGWSSFFWIAAGVFSMKYVDGAFDLACSKMQRAGNVIAVAIINVTRSLVSVPAFAGIYLTTHNLPLSLFAVSALWIALFSVQRKRFDLTARACEVFDITAENLKRRFLIARHLFPFGISLVVTSLGVYAPRFLLVAILGPKELGLFSAVFHFLVIGALVASSIGEALLPFLASGISNHSVRKFWQQVFWPSALVQSASMIGVIVAMAAGSKLLIFFYGPAFAGEGHMLVVAAIAAGPIYCAAIITRGCYAAQMRRGLLLIQSTSLLVVIGVTLMLVPSFGPDGAFAGMMISAIVQIIMSVVLLIRFFSYRAAVFSAR